MDLYGDEKQEMVEKKILDRVFLALSREPSVPKVRCFNIYLQILIIVTIRQFEGFL